ncbi:MAG: serine hydrolase domain-containing protein [Candidatus Eiseniibacteriota bacterium]
MRSSRVLVIALAIAGITLTQAWGQEPGASRDTEDFLLGVWTFDTTFATGPSGSLTVTRKGSTWRAEISRVEATSEVSGREVRFTFPDEFGRFRGELAQDGRTLEGLWIRPGVTSDPRYPGGSSQPFATPLSFTPVGRDEWRAEVRPLADSIAVHLRVFRDEKGTLVGTFRNPDQGSLGGAMRFQVTREGTTVRFRYRDSPSDPEMAIDATLVSDRVLRVFWPRLKRLVDFKRGRAAVASTFFPRPPDDPLYRYRQPPATGDGWTTARAREVGIDEDSLTQVVRRIIANDPSSNRPSLIHSFLVARRGKLVLEEYFFGWERDRPHDMRSAGKTFSSVMMGAVRMQGVKISPETRVFDLLAAGGPYANPDPRKERITLAHLMTHSAGLALDDNNDDSPGNENTMQAQREQPDWWKYTLDLPMAHAPGERYAYGSANTNLMGAALTTATRTWLPRLFEVAVARPLQFGPWHWNLMPNDEGYLGGGAWLRPRDLLKVGQAYLDGGVWNGKPIVDSTWVRESTAPRFHISPATTGLAPEEFSNAYSEADEAYAWHLGKLKSGNREYPLYNASGNGGQILMVVPELELVFVFTGGNFAQGCIWTRWPSTYVGEGILPAMTP